MEKFLEIVYTNQLADSEKGDEFLKIFSPYLERLKGILSESLYEDIDELFTDCAVETARFYAVEGMKLAIEIMNGSYVAKV